MNLNDYPEELREEEQLQLDKLVKKMDDIISKLDDRMKSFVREAKDSKNSGNPDAYAGIVLARQGIRDTQANRQKVIEARDELYRTRLLLECRDANGKTVEEFKIGLHSCQDKDKIYVVSWYRPVFRHYVLNNDAKDFKGITKDKNGQEFEIEYSLLAKNDVTLRFTKVVKALNIFPGMFSEDMLSYLMGKGFFSDKYIQRMLKYAGDEELDFDENYTEKIIYDEFLQELLERRASAEFKNIVFSIQKKQSEIIQAPYERSMIVQGCAGSGKSMIMLHRLPIVLFDNPNSLERSNLYIITPSEAYMQLAENMRKQLEISDINMGTLRQYYDYCIKKYHRKPEEYGRIRNGSKLSEEQIRYAYSSSLILDISEAFEKFTQRNSVNLDKAYRILRIPEERPVAGDTYNQIVMRKSIEVQRVIRENTSVLTEYFRTIRDIVNAYQDARKSLEDYKGNVISGIRAKIKQDEKKVVESQATCDGMNDDLKEMKTALLAGIEESKKRIANLLIEIDRIEQDEEEYFEDISSLVDGIMIYMTPYLEMNRDFEKNDIEKIYDFLDGAGQLIGAYYTLAWKAARLGTKYDQFLADPSKSVSSIVNELGKSIKVLEGINKKYLSYDYYKQINELAINLSGADQKITVKVYEDVMKKLGVEPDKKGVLRALPCSPYIFLQTLYLYYGVPSGAKETFLSIDEAQGLTIMELLLLKNINGEKVVFNLFGDIKQHIECDKGLDDWDALMTEFDFDIYEMQENYRNASQITQYCNQRFGMNMVAINTPGQGVREVHTFDEFAEGLRKLFMGEQKAGNAAIIVKNQVEAKYLIDKFSVFADKMNDMTGETFSIHSTRWNILLIEEAKGLEFTAVVAVSGRMSENEKYIAYTRALDELIVFDGVLDISEYEKKAKSKIASEDDVEDEIEKEQVEKQNKRFGGNKSVKKQSEKREVQSKLREYFVERGLKVIDNRQTGGYLWVIGDRSEIEIFINEAAIIFGSLQGRYMVSREIGNQSGWCTKTKK